MDNDLKTVKNVTTLHGHSPLFALVDCNSFYASCEKLFRPDLKHKPVVVLSNNDGCIVARSAEAKTLNIKMGVPVFQVKESLANHGVHVFSSNYALYGDISARVMSTLEGFTPVVEIYSIDEAFLGLQGMPITDLVAYGRDIRTTIADWVGIPVCVGIAPTKTLAKLANHAAKRYPATQGVVDLTDPKRQQKLLSITPVGDIWGIGRRLEKQLAADGIITAWDLANQEPKHMRDRFSIVLERTIRELKGETCFTLETSPPTKQQILSSRSFGKRVTQYQHMREAICHHISKGVEKLRLEQRQAKVLTIFIRTSAFSNEAAYGNSISGSLTIASDDTRTFIALAVGLLEGIWKDGYQYAKAGIMLSDFHEERNQQQDLFLAQSQQKNQTLMSLIDRINKKSKGQLFFASQGTHIDWGMKQDYLSPAYTTRWADIPHVR